MEQTTLDQIDGYVVSINVCVWCGFQCLVQREVVRKTTKPIILFKACTKANHTIGKYATKILHIM